MNISKVEEYIGYTMSKELLKDAMGDGMEFELVYQAMMDSIDKTNSNNEEKSDGQETLDNVYTGSLDTMPIIMKGETVYGRKPLDYSDVEKMIEKINIVNGSENQSQSNIQKPTNKYEMAEGEELDRICSAVEKYSKKYNVDKDLIMGIIKQESNFDKDVVSHSGAMGLMQLMDFNVEAYGITDPFNIEQNIEGGVKHIKMCLDLFDGNTEMALMAYNGGQGTMSKRGVTSPEHLYKMPEETQNYVPKVMRYYKNGVL